jgi:hypothetical protein
MVLLLHNFSSGHVRNVRLIELELVCYICRPHRWLQWDAVSYPWETSKYSHCVYWVQSWREPSHKIHGWNRSVQITKRHWWHIHMSRLLCHWVSMAVMYLGLHLIMMLQCVAVPGESWALWDQSLVKMDVTVRSSFQVSRTVLWRVLLGNRPINTSRLNTRTQQ